MQVAPLAPHADLDLSSKESLAFLPAWISKGVAVVAVLALAPCMGNSLVLAFTNLIPLPLLRIDDKVVMPTEIL